MKRIYYVEYFVEDMDSPDCDTPYEVFQGDGEDEEFYIHNCNDVEVFDSDTLRTRFSINFKEYTDWEKNEISFRNALKRAKAVVHYMSDNGVPGESAVTGVYEIIL